MATKRVVIAAEMQGLLQSFFDACSDNYEIIECVANEASSLPASLAAVLNAFEAEQSCDAVTVKNFVEVTVPAYSMLEFKQHFRLSRSTFEELLTDLAPLLITERSSHVPMHVKLLLTLWTLGNQETFRQIGDRFGMNRGNAHLYYAQVCSALNKLRQQYIRWPSNADMRKISNGFNFPSTIGAIDGSHIRIKAPLTNLEAYTNRKSFTSVVLQAVCDSRMYFCDVSVGWPGSMHDARIFRLSALGKKLERENIYPYHILGDSAYPLKPYLIVPFRDNGFLSREEKQFNLQHSASRCVIERAFARLKGKFRRLKYLDMDKFSLIGSVITAACVLHNYIIEHETESADEADDYYEDLDKDTLNVSDSTIPSGTDRRHEILHVIT